MINCSTPNQTKPNHSAPGHTLPVSDRPELVARTVAPSDVYDRMDKFKDCFEGWQNYYVRRDLGRLYGEWAAGLAPWLWTATFTTRDILGFETVNKSLRWFLFEANKRLYGKNFTNKIGHNYFSYMVGMEKQERGAYHFHMIGDEPADYLMWHEVWGNALGFLWIDQIKKIEDAVNYVCKYIAKDGEVDLFIRKEKVYPPKPLPTWWKAPGKVIYQAKGEELRHLVIGAKLAQPVLSETGSLPSFTTLDKNFKQGELL